MASALLPTTPAPVLTDHNHFFPPRLCYGKSGGAGHRRVAAALSTSSLKENAESWSMIFLSHPLVLRTHHESCRRLLDLAESFPGASEPKKEVKLHHHHRAYASSTQERAPSHSCRRHSAINPVIQWFNQRKKFSIFPYAPRTDAARNASSTAMNVAVSKFILQV